MALTSCGVGAAMPIGSRTSPGNNNNEDKRAQHLTGANEGQQDRGGVARQIGSYHVFGFVGKG